jgi:ABC-type Fe3+-hydroxamate transport system substrate-binding protein
MTLRITDDMGRVVTLPRPPQRVVSLVPSDTLNVAALGAGGVLVGRTDYCELPAELVAGVPSVGGTKNPNLDAICDLMPELVIANQEENTKADLEALAQRGVKILVCFPKRVAEGLSHLARLARVFGVEGDPAVRDLLKAGYEAIREAEAARVKLVPLRTFCPIWMDPLMTIHGSTFISDMLDLAGAQNVFSHRERRYPLAADLGRAAPLPNDKTAGKDTRYPRITLDEVVSRAPELVLLPDEPHPFSEEDAKVFLALDLPASTRGSVVHVSGKDLCWYGAQSVEGIGRVRGLIASLRER